MRHHHPRHSQPVHRPFAPSGPGGVTSLGPGQTLRATPPPQEYYCVRISLIGGDPNMNGGRDSNGYYRGYLEGMRYPPAAVTSGPVSVEVRVYYDANSAFFTDGLRLMAYQFQMTIGASTPTDNGFMLLMPCYNGPNTPIGKVTTIIPAVGGGHGVCELYDSLGNDTGEAVNVYNLADYPFGLGVVTPLFFDEIQKHWYPANFQDVFIGYTNATNVNSGSTGTFQFTDSQGVNLFTGTVRAIGYVARRQQVIIWFDYPNAEWACTAINVPLYVQAQGTIAYQTTGAVSVLQSDKTNPTGGAVTASPYMAYRTLAKGEFGLMWYDFFKEVLYAVPLNSILLGVQAIATTVAAGSTGTVEIYDDKGNDLMFSIAAVRALVTIPINTSVKLWWDATNNEFFMEPFISAGLEAYGNLTAATSISFTNAVFAKVPYSTAGPNSTTFITQSTANNNFTVSKTGSYFLTADIAGYNAGSIVTGAIADDRFQLQAFVNGSAIGPAQNGSAAIFAASLTGTGATINPTTCVAMSGPLQLTAADVVDVRISGLTRNGSLGATTGNFSLFYLGP